MAKQAQLVQEKPSAPVPDPAIASKADSAPPETKVEETPFEALASICSVLVVGLFILTFLAQNFVIPSGSMEKTLLIGDHLFVDRITLAPRSNWMPLVHYRQPKRGDIVVFFKPGEPDTFLVKRLIGVPGDHIHLNNGVVFLNGVPQREPKNTMDPDDAHAPFEDEFPNYPSYGSQLTTEWEVDLPNHVQGNDLVVPPGMYFMMGDHRHHSLDSRFWGFVPQENVVGRPLFNYWSFVTPADQMYKTTLLERLHWMGHVVKHFFPDTRWKRTFNPVN